MSFESLPGLFATQDLGIELETQALLRKRPTWFSSIAVNFLQKTINHFMIFLRCLICPDIKSRDRQTPVGTFLVYSRKPWQSPEPSRGWPAWWSPASVLQTVRHRTFVVNVEISLPWQQGSIDWGSIWMIPLHCRSSETCSFVRESGTYPLYKSSYSQFYLQIVNFYRASAVAASPVLATIGMSVRPSHADIVWKRRKLGSRNLHRRIAQGPCSSG